MHLSLHKNKEKSPFLFLAQLEITENFFIFLLFYLCIKKLLFVKPCNIPSPKPVEVSLQPCPCTVTAL